MSLESVEKTMTWPREDFKYLRQAVLALPEFQSYQSFKAVFDANPWLQPYADSIPFDRPDYSLIAVAEFIRTTFVNQTTGEQVGVLPVILGTLKEKYGNDPKFAKNEVVQRVFGRIPDMTGYVIPDPRSVSK